MSTTSKVLDNKFLLALIGRRIPAIYDVYPRRDWAMGEPHPIPWIAAGAELGRLVVQSALAAQRAGGKPLVALDYLDGWCPLGKPTKLPIPWPSPWGGDDPPPRPEETESLDLYLGLAIGLATAGALVQDKGLIEVVDKAIARSLDAIGSTIN